MEDQSKSKEQLIAELAEMRQREAQWRSAIANVPTFVMVVDSAGTIQFINRTQPGTAIDEAVGKTAFDFTWPEHHNTLRQSLDRVFRTAETCFFESAGSGPDGSTSCYETYMGPIKVDDRVVAATIVANDITERKRTEEDLAKSKAILQATIESLPIDFFAIGPDGRYILDNAACRENWGQLVGKTPEEACPDKAVLSLWLENNRRAFAGEKVEEEVEVTVKGERRFCYNVIAPVREDGKIRGILGVNIDVTERKRAEEALQKVHDELEAKVEERTADLTKANGELAVFKRFVEAAGEGFAMADLNHQVTYANPAMLGLMGLHKSDQMLGQNLMSIHPAHVQSAIRETVIPTIIQGGHWKGEIPIRNRAGQKRHALANAFLVRNEQGEPCHYAVVVTDITERKQAEESLRQTRDKLQAIYDGMPDGLVLVDRETMQIVRANASICRMVGYSEDELLSMSVKELHSLKQLPTTAEAAQAEAEGRLHIHEDAPVLRKDGSIFYADIVNNYVDYSGRRCVIGFFRDITERKQTQAALRQSHDELRAIYDGTVDGLLVTDIETLRFVRANGSICRMLGYSETDFRSLSLRDIHPAEALPYIVERIRSVAGGNLTTTGEIPFLRKDGSVFYAEAIGKFLSYDGRACSMGIFRDITERKQAQEALQQSHDELRTIYDSMIEGLLILDFETKRLLRVNSSLSRMVGYTEEELLSMSVLDIHPPEDAAANLANIQARREGNFREDVNVPVLRKDGSVFFVDIMGNGLTYGGRPCVLGLFRDITERRQAQAALEREQQTLKYMLQSSDHERQLIAYEIHDGLAQYLAASIMQFEAYHHLKETKPKDAAKAYDAGMTMLRQSHADARRLISGVKPPILDEAGIVAAVSHLVNEHKRQDGSKIELLSKVEFDRLAPILENAAYRIVQEALTNACRHSKSKRIQVELVQHGDVLRLKVQDWGVGFNLGEVEEDRFGLAGMRERARLLGGSIIVESTPGQGTCIAVELPLMVRE